ncbi:uncharacterized protein [Aegilops tauschii subsp. strangulata]|uniref:uncharacterized protein isoform X3 n=1 Tax=Aegilops tauschii subsp. strangulata TaxID=200361 RepID=UPI001ABCC249|nr:uncharacterized protein LOC109783788 isoform X3 [Aegilops tauschii subsp. strangulata]
MCWIGEPPEQGGRKQGRSPWTSPNSHPSSCLQLQVAATTKKTPNSRIPNYLSLTSQLLCQVHNITMHEFRKCQTPAATACTTTRMMASSPTLAPSSPTPGRGPVHGGCGLVASSGNPIPSIFLRRRAHPPDSPAGIKAVAWTLPPSTKEGVSSRRWRRPCSTSYFVVPAIRGVPLKTVPSPFCFFYYLLLLLLLIGLCMVQWIQHDASAAITCFLVYHPGTMGASSSSSIPSYCTTAGVHTPYSFWSISTSYCSSW